jgi:hypothetical protein
MSAYVLEQRPSMPIPQAARVPGNNGRFSKADRLTEQAKTQKEPKAEATFFKSQPSAGTIPYF